MGSKLISKARTCLRHLQPFLTTNASAWKLSQCTITARCLCTRDTYPNSARSQSARRNRERADGEGGAKDKTARRRPPSWDRSMDGGGPSSTSTPRLSLRESVFSAGTAERRAKEMKVKRALVEESDEVTEKELEGAEKYKPPDRPLSAAKWRKLKDSLENHPRFDRKMILALTKARAELSIAKSLLSFVAVETGALPYDLLLQYLILCVKGGHNAEVFDVYNIMRTNFPSLETGASTLFIKSFSQTERWRDALVILQEVKKTFKPSSSNYGEIIAAAVVNGDKTTAWALHDELLENGLSPNQKIWDSLFKGTTKTKDAEGMETGTMSQSEDQERLLGILHYMRDNQIYPRISLASSIKTWFESLPGQKWKGSWTKATSNGLCRCCGSQLESIQLTDEEYQKLKDRVMTDIIEAGDTFQKTTPEELKDFKAFMKRSPAFDVVIDGLNVGNTKAKDKSTLSANLLVVVSELESQGLTILVLGRKHMLRHSKTWSSHKMNLIQKKAHCFFTANISEDDPFVLYATLHSGNHCLIVSQDLMRDHKACLPDAASRRLFFKWQRGHQLVVGSLHAASQTVQFLSIPSYDTIVQTSGDSWHIPYDDNDENRASYEVPQRWLCLTKNSS